LLKNILKINYKLNYMDDFKILLQTHYIISTTIVFSILIGIYIIFRKLLLYYTDKPKIEEKVIEVKKFDILERYSEDFEDEDNEMYENMLLNALPEEDIFIRSMYSEEKNDINKIKPNKELLRELEINDNLSYVKETNLEKIKSRYQTKEKRDESFERLSKLNSNKELLRELEVNNNISYFKEINLEKIKSRYQTKEKRDESFERLSKLNPDA